MKKHCGECKQYKEVYGQYEIEYEAVEETVERRDLLVEGKEKLDDLDIVGVVLCKECYECFEGEK